MQGEVRMLGRGLRIVVNCGLIALVAACTTPATKKLNEVIDQNIQAGPEPAPVPEFLSRNPNVVFPVALCRFDEEYCYHILPQGASQFLAALGPITYPQPTLHEILGRASLGIRSQEVVWNHWLSCFIAERDGRLYAYYARNGQITGTSTRAMGVIFVARPDNDSYEKT